MRDKIGDDARIAHVIEYINEIETAIMGVNYEAFCDNHVLRIAVVKWLEIIGEAANNITNETRNNYPGVEWHKIIGLRNIVVHEYFRIDFGIIWDAATIFLSQLKKEISTIKLDSDDKFLTN